MTEIVSPNLNRKILQPNNALTPNNLFNARNLEINLNEELTPHSENRLGGFIPYIPKRDLANNNSGNRFFTDSFYENQIGKVFFFFFVIIRF